MDDGRLSPAIFALYRFFGNRGSQVTTPTSAQSVMLRELRARALIELRRTRSSRPTLFSARGALGAHAEPSALRAALLVEDPRPTALVQLHDLREDF